MRLRGISNREDANVFLPTFIEDYNRRFAVEPSSPINAHRMALPDAATLDLIFSFQHERKLSKNLEMSYDSIIYQVKVSGVGYGLRHAKIRVCEDLAGTVTLLYHGRLLNYICHEKQKHAAQIVSSKQLERKMNDLNRPVKKHIFGPNHPWRHYVINPFNVSEKLANSIKHPVHSTLTV